jgi:DNA-binding response OmpR family regulator
MTNTPGANASILLLDSDPLTRTILGEALERVGHVVMATSDLGEAVDRLKRMRPDLLIVRPYINGMPGQMAAQYLRARRPGLPVLIVDGFMDDDRIRVQNAAHQFHIFPQPFAPDELVREVRDVLRKVNRTSTQPT